MILKKTVTGCRNDTLSTPCQPVSPSASLGLYQVTRIEFLTVKACEKFNTASWGKLDFQPLYIMDK